MTETKLSEVVEELKAATTAELAEKPDLPTGACCLYTIGLFDCTGSMTERACKDIAERRGLQYEWTKGKQCSDVKCPP